LPDRAIHRRRHHYVAPGGNAGRRPRGAARRLVAGALRQPGWLGFGQLSHRVHIDPAGRDRRGGQQHRRGKPALPDWTWHLVCDHREPAVWHAGPDYRANGGGLDPGDVRRAGGLGIGDLPAPGFFRAGLAHSRPAPAARPALVCGGKLVRHDGLFRLLTYRSKPGHREPSLALDTP
jgi:hypothetical protein